MFGFLAHRLKNSGSVPGSRRHFHTARPHERESLLRFAWINHVLPNSGFSW